MGVKAPVAELILYAETTLVLKFATYANLPDGSTATEKGLGPVGNGEPGMGVKAPVC
jgi:hypothetical protein